MVVAEQSRQGPSRRRTSEEGRTGLVAELAERLSAIERHDRRRQTSEPQQAGAASRDADARTKAERICLRLLTSSAKTRAELAGALGRAGVADDVAESVLNRYAELGLVDDEAFARTFVDVKHRDRALGAAALRSELRRRGIDDDVAATAVTTIDSDAERGRASAFIARRIDAAMSAGPVAAQRRLLAMLARRGYSADLASAVVSDALRRYASETGEPVDGIA